MAIEMEPADPELIIKIILKKIIIDSEESTKKMKNKGGYAQRCW